ncbi:hypothetical protein T439DRAFT_339005 [Meredithblackwellia eburnea MCA 4105]
MLHGLYILVNNVRTPLTLVNVDASAEIKDLAAQVTLTQHYHLPTSLFNAPVEAKYSFPVPNRAAVHSFVLIKEDGTRVVATVQEKQEAKDTYDKAVEEGHFASLMEQDSPDAFSVSVGNILPNEHVKVELKYSTELTEDEENDSIRFHVPAVIGARYGAPPTPTITSRWASSYTDSSSTFFSFSCNIESLTPIAKISCPSHTVETTLGPDPSVPNASSLVFSNYARVAFSSPKALERDIILTLKAASLDSPRCIAEVHPEDKSIALKLTMVPRFKLPDVKEQEFVFLVDRSGSMSGSRIETAKKALVVLLRSLPTSGTFFNVFSFGTHVDSLWRSSKNYNQKSLEEATLHVDRMSANYGGTEIRLAMEAVFKARKTDRPTSLFVLTDGDAWDLDNVLESVKSSVTKAPSGAYLRVFTLGIGNSSSTAMVEGIARVGNGVSASVVDGESFTGKTTRLLKAARSPLIENITVEYAGVTAESEKDDGFEILSDGDSEHTMAQVEEPAKVPLSLFNDDVDPMEVDKSTASPAPAVVLPPPSLIQQSPHIVRHLSPANRFYAYTILAGASQPIPSEVTIRGRLFDGTPVTLTVPVTVSQLVGSTSVHTLAARKIIQDLEDGQHDSSLADGDKHDTDHVKELVKASVIRIGKKYSLASTHTSFVAVDKSSAPRVFYKSAKKSKGFGSAIFSLRRSAPSTSAYQCAPPPGSAVSTPQQQAPRMSAGGGAVFGSAAATASSGVTRQSILGGYGASRWLSAAPSAAPPPPPPAPCMAAPAPLGRYEMDASKAKSATPSPKFRYRSSYDASDPSLDLLSSSSSTSLEDESSPASSPEMRSAKEISSHLSSADKLDALVRLQAFDGSFAPKAIELCGAKATVTFGVTTNQALAATLVAILFMEKQLASDKDAWEVVWEKASDFCRGVVTEVEVAELKVKLAIALGW